MLKPRSRRLSAEYLESRLALTGAIEGVVWHDLNENGAMDANERGLPDWTVYIDANGNGEFDIATDQIASEGDPIAIPSVGTIQSDLVVGEFASLIVDVDVEISIEHSYDADLVVSLISPSGTRVQMFSRVGGSANNFTGTILDDEADMPIASGTAPFTGRYRPSGSLSDFQGEDPRGTWTLEVVDSSSGDSGRLLGWSMTVTGVSERSEVTDETGRYRFQDLEPGEYRIRPVQTDGWRQTAPEDGEWVRDVTDDQVSSDTSFGFFGMPAEIHGSMWNDLNANGNRDADEPGLAGWTVYLGQQHGSGLVDRGAVG